MRPNPIYRKLLVEDEDISVSGLIVGSLRYPAQGGNLGQALVLGPNNTITFDNIDRSLTVSISGTGTVNYIPKFVAPRVLGLSKFYDTGSFVGLGTEVPTNTLDINGTLRVRQIVNATGSFLTVSSSGVLQQRTPAEVLVDIGAEPAFSKGNLVQGSGITLTGTLANRLVSTGSLTIEHADTSTQSTITNNSGSVIQSITLDTFGHITALGSINLDTRYYTEIESDNRFVPYTGSLKNTDLGEYGIRGGYYIYDTTPTATPTVQGATYWDVDDNTVAIIMNGAIQKVGEDSFYPVKNQTGTLIPKGTNVRFAGTVGNSGRLLIAPFIANGSFSSIYYMGVTMEDIANGADGKVMWFGRIRGINTNAYNESDILYASTTVAGGFQTTAPLAPNNIIVVAAVITKSANVGTIFVRPQIGSNINNDEGVKIATPINNQSLVYSSGSGLWENKITRFAVNDSSGSLKFYVNNESDIRFEGSGDTSVSFNDTTRTVIISSTGGSSGGTGVVSFNGRDGAVTSQAGDYNTSQVTETTNLYFTETRVRNTLLTGLSSSTSAIVATDSILTAFGKTQGQLNVKQPLAANLTSLASLVYTSPAFVKMTGVDTFTLDTNTYLTTVNLGYTASPTNGIVTSSAGTSATLPLVDTTNAGLMSPGDKTKLNNIAANANNYVHPAYSPVSQSLSGAAVLATFSSDAIGSVTGFTTRSLTVSDIGAEAAFSKGSLVQGSGITLSGSLSGRLVGSGNITVSTPEDKFVRVLTVPGVNFSLDLEPQIVSYFNNLNPPYQIGDDETKIDFLVTQSVTSTIQCSTNISSPGGVSYPTTQDIYLGEGTGSVVLSYSAQSAPDRFIVRFNNQVVIDTGYRGASDYDFGGSSRATFIASLNGKLDPITGNLYPDLTTYPDDGYPRILGTGTGTASFTKSTTSTLARVQVYAPMSGTVWDFSLGCPGSVSPTSKLYRIVYELVDKGKGSYGASNQQIDTSNLLKIEDTRGQITESEVKDLQSFSLSDYVPKSTVLTFTTNNGITGGASQTLANSRSWTFSLTGQALALHNLATTGFIVRTSPNTVVTRSLTAGTGITISNIDGISGNPTIATTITQYTDALARAAISLTTTGNSGAATYSNTTGVLNIPNYTLTGLGGFANPMTTLGDIIYGATSGTPTRLAGNTTTAKQYLSQTGTGTTSAVPVWTTIAGSDVTGAALTKTDDTNVTLTLGGSPATALLRAASLTLGWTGTLAIARGGTGLSALGTANQLIRVNAGATALEYFTPSFLTAAVTSLNGLTAAVQTFANDTNVTITSATSTHTLGWSGQLAVGRGGTGASTLTGVVIGNGASAMTAVVGTASQLLRRNATNTAYEFFTHDFINQAGARTSISLTTTGNSGAATYTSATGVFNIPNYTLTGLGGFANPMTTLGDTIYGAASGSATRLAGNTTTTRQYLSQTGTGTASAAPVWSQISGSDVTGAALTETDDTNVTLTLGGTPSTALLRAVSMTLGWTGQLAVGRGGTGASTLTGVVIGNGASAMTTVAGTASQLLRRNATNTAYEFFTHDFVNQAGARSAVSLTTTGNSGAATYSSSTGVFNVPNYTLSGLGGSLQAVTDIGNTTTNQINIARLSISGTGTWFTMRSTTASSNFGAFNRASDNSAGGYLGFDAGGIQGGGDGTTFGIRSDADLILMSGATRRMLIKSSTGNVLVNTTDDSGNTLRVNGTVRVDSVTNATGDIVTIDANSVLRRRTASQILTDINGELKAPNGSYFQADYVAHSGTGGTTFLSLYKNSTGGTLPFAYYSGYYQQRKITFHRVRGEITFASSYPSFTFVTGTNESNSLNFSGVPASTYRYEVDVITIVRSTTVLKIHLTVKLYSDSVVYQRYSYVERTVADMSTNDINSYVAVAFSASNSLNFINVLSLSVVEHRTTLSDNNLN